MLSWKCKWPINLKAPLYGPKYASQPSPPSPKDFIIFQIQCHQLGTKCSPIGACEDRFTLNPCQLLEGFLTLRDLWLCMHVTTLLSQHSDRGVQEPPTEEQLMMTYLCMKLMRPTDAHSRACTTTSTLRCLWPWQGAHQAGEM